MHQAGGHGIVVIPAMSIWWLWRQKNMQKLSSASLDGVKRVYNAAQCPYLAWYAFSIRCRCFCFSRRAGVIKSLNVASDSDCRGYADIFAQV